MNLIKGNLSIRNANTTDAEQLCMWWNDGKIMAHAGFPNGLNETPEKIRESLSKDNDETHRRHIIELSGKPIGEMNYRNVGNKTAEIGIKICDFIEREKGYGTTLLSMFIDALFTYCGYERVILDTNIKNERAQHVYEKKLGFRRMGVRENSWRNQMGEMQTSIDYELTKEDWITAKNEPLEYIRLRLECPSDYRAVEELTREAFWDNNQHICDEHLLVHRLRNSQSFVPELDYVAEIDGKLAGHIIYAKSRIEDDLGKTYETLTFGPLSVLPDFWYKGVGTALLQHSIYEAKRLGYRAILIYGHPDYYPRVGFRRAAEFGIKTPSGNTFDPFMALPLYDGALAGIQGRYFIDPVYDNLTESDVLEFEKNFPAKEKYIPIPISTLLNRLNPDAKKAIEGLGCQSLEDMKAKSEHMISELIGADKNTLEIIRAVMAENNYRWGEPYRK